MSDVMTIARPYAEAIFEIAIQNDELKRWSDTLKSLALIAGNKNMQPVLNNPLIPREQLADLFLDITGPALNQEAKNLVSVLASRKRLSLLPAISAAYENCVAEHERIIEVKVVSAYPLDQ